MPEVSVIMPAYNAGAFIEEAVRSAIGQEGVDLEVVVVDLIVESDFASLCETRWLFVQRNRVRVQAGYENTVKSDSQPLLSQ